MSYDSSVLEVFGGISGPPRKCSDGLVADWRSSGIVVGVSVVQSIYEKSKEGRGGERRGER